MPVAKSYACLNKIGEPYNKNGKMYILVETKSGSQKEVRWYSDKEYARMYPGEVVEINPITKISQRKVLGFGDAGYITIFKGNSYPYKEWLKENGATYTRLWGWSIASDKPVPELPEELVAVRLNWSDVCADDKNLKNEDAIKAFVETIIYEPGVSEYQGEIGERLDLYLTVDKVIVSDNYFGVNYFHIFSDEIGNIYSWSTSAKQLEEEKEYHIVGTVKEHKVYKGNQQTILTRCKIIND